MEQKSVNNYLPSHNSKFNLGAGPNLRFTFGHHFQEQAAVEFSFAYRSHTSVFESDPSALYSWRKTNSMQMTQASLGFRLIAQKGIMHIYLRSGINLGITPVWISEFEFINEVPADQNKILRYRYYSGFALGAYTSFGAVLPVHKRSCITFEVFANMQSWSPWFGKYIYVEKNDKNVTADYYPNVTYFVRRKTTNDINYATRFNVPMSNFGLQIGWHYMLNEKQKKPISNQTR